MIDFYTPLHYFQYIGIPMILLGVFGLIFIWMPKNKESPNEGGYSKQNISFGELWKQAYQYDQKLNDIFPSKQITTSQGFTIGFDAGIIKLEGNHNKEMQLQNNISPAQIRRELIKFLREKTDDVALYQKDDKAIQAKTARYNELLKEMENEFPLSYNALKDSIAFEEKANITNKHLESLFEYIKNKSRINVKHFLIEECEFTIVGFDNNGNGLLEVTEKNNQGKVQIKMLQHTLTEEGKIFLGEHANKISQPLTVFASIPTKDSISSNKITLYSLLVTQ
jgi:hypothetical protein